MYSLYLCNLQMCNLCGVKEIYVLIFIVSKIVIFFTNTMNYINCIHINIQIIFYSIFIINYGSKELQH